MQDDQLAPLPLSRPTDITRERGTAAVPGLRTPEFDTQRLSGMDDSVRDIPLVPGKHTVMIENDDVEVSLSVPSVLGREKNVDTGVSSEITEPIGVPQRPLTFSGISQVGHGAVSIEESGHLDEFLKEASPAPVSSVPVPAPEPTVADMVLSLQHDIEKIVSDRSKLEEHTAELVRERKKIEDELEPLKQEQEHFDTRISDIEKSERTSFDVKAKRANEADRWELIEERYQNELQVVSCRERLEKAIEDILHDEITYKELVKEEELLRKRIETMEAEGKKRELEKTLNDAVQKRKNVEEELQKLSSEKTRISELLSTLGQKEAGIESQTGKIGELEEGAKSAEELRRLAGERYQLEKERHETEKARWAAEDDIALLESQYQNVAQRLSEAEAKQVEIERKIRDLGLS